MGLSQAEFGEMLGVSDKAVSTWENELKYPRMGIIEKISQRFSIAKSQIIDSEISVEDIHKLSVPIFSPHEQKVIIAYRNKPEMQPAVDKLLGVEENKKILPLPKAGEEDTKVRYVARGGEGGEISLPEEEVRELLKSMVVESESDL